MTSCGSSQLDTGCGECFSAVAGRTLPPPGPAGRVAIATVWDGGHGYACAIPLWCQGASRLASVVGDAELLILSPKVSEDCPNARYLQPARTIQAAQSYLHRHEGRLGRNSGQRGAFAVSNLLKVAFLSLGSTYELLLYADLDIDLMARPLDAATWRSGAEALLRSSALFVSLFDHASPVNGGLWLVRPRCDVFSQAVELLERGRWSAAEGFDGVGAPRSFLRSRMREVAGRLAAGSDASLFKVEGTINGTHYGKLNSWDFVNGALDQGLLWYLFYLKNDLGTWARYDRGELPWRVEHFWGVSKPWRAAAARGYWKRLAPLEGGRSRRTHCRNLSKRGSRWAGAASSTASKSLVGPLPWPEGMRRFGDQAASWDLSRPGDCRRSGPDCKQNREAFSI